MRRLISEILVFALILSVIPFTAACTDNSAEEVQTEKLTYYILAETYDRFTDFAKRYNRYCYEEYEDDPSYQIEFVEFESEEEMYAKLSTELMAGKGPDLVSLEQKLPFEKLIKQNVFADIYGLLEDDESDNKIDWSQYNQTVLDACSYDGSLYILPVAFGNDVLIGNKNILDKYNITQKNGSTLTYDSIGDTFSEYLNSDDEVSFGEDAFMYDQTQLLYKFIFSYVDFENEEVYFDTPEFESALDSIISLNDRSGSGESDNNDRYSRYGRYGDYFESSSLFESTGNSFSATSWNYGTSDDYVIFNGFARNEDDYNAYIQIGYAVNKNSKKKAQLTSLINYSLEELVQEFYCDAWDFQMNSGGTSHPIKNKAFEKSVEAATNLKDYEGNAIESSNGVIRTYVDITEKANKFSFYEQPSQSYYAREIIGDIVGNYLSGKITKAKFIRQLTSATKIYLDE